MKLIEKCLQDQNVQYAKRVLLSKNLVYWQVKHEYHFVIINFI